jgi:chaperone modulatory protein CbpM
MTYPLSRPVLTTAPASMSLEAFAAAGGIHPDLVRRLVRLGVLEADSDAAGRWWFAPAELVALARARRLRAGLALNYAALGVVLDLLQRIDQLEAALRMRGKPAA